jgi:hypothetical protein
MRKNKYGNRRVTVQGITFASAAEGARYAELLLLARAGQIRGLRLQPRYALHAAGRMVGHAVFDFEFHQGSEKIIEDVKGMDLPLSRWKRKHFEAEYGITVRVVKLAVRRRRAV